MEGPRPLNEDERPEFIDFLSHQLRPGKAWSIADEYPLAMDQANLNNVRVMKESASFVSAAVMKPLVIKSPCGVYKVAAIGSVVTAPEHRNRGLSRQVLQECLNAGRDHGCDFAILWTNLFDFYRKLGFELAGSEISLFLPEDLQVKPAPNLRFMNSAKIDPEALLRLYSQHTTGSVRTIEDVRRFLQIPNARVFTAWDEHNKIQAYAVEGKGADLQSYIHEWGGGVSKLLPLLKFALQERKTELTLISPGHSGNLIRQLKEAGATEHSGVLGMVKILNPPAFLTKIKKYIRAMGVENAVLEARDGKYYIGFGEEICSTDSECDLVRLIFGPIKASELHGFQAATSEAFERVFPIPMWVWGWDSV